MDAGDGCRDVVMAGLMLVVLLAIVAAIGGVLVTGGATVVGEYRVRAEEAKAESIRAQADVVEARTAREREANVHREQMFQMWTVALMGFAQRNDGLLVVLSGVLGVVCGVGIVRWLGRMEWYP